MNYLDNNTMLEEQTNLKHRKIPLWIISLFFLIIFLIWNVGVDKFFRYLLLGLPQGGIIALIAIGYSMVYGIVQLINFAHGEVFMMSAYLVITLAVGGRNWSTNVGVVMSIFIGIISIPTFILIWGEKIHKRYLNIFFSIAQGIIIGLFFFFLFKHKLTYWVACFFSVIFTSLLGIAIDQFAYKPLRKSSRLVPLITAIGVSLFLSNFAQIVWGTQSMTYPTEMLPKMLTTPYIVDGKFLTTQEINSIPFFDLLIKDRRIRISENLVIPLIDLIIFFLAISLMAIVQIFLLKTRTGKAMRACSQDMHAAWLMGIDVNKIIAITFGIGSFLAALCSPLYVIKYAPLEPTMGYIVGILAFASAVLGGIGNIPGAMFGGFCIGIIYNFVPLFETLDSWKIIVLLKGSRFFPGIENWNFLAGITQWRLGIAFTFMLGVILIKPQGLLGAVEAKKRA